MYWLAPSTSSLRVPVDSFHYPFFVQIYHTPHLIESLLEHFLPYNFPPSTGHTNVANQLSDGYGVPLPNILKLMRLLAQRSASIRLALINDHKLIERCLCYLLEALPPSLPLSLRDALKSESWRCLTVCLEGPTPPSRAVELVR